jgi:hypothetical protein
VNLPWANPNALAELTIPQLFLLNDARPGDAIESAGDFAALMERRRLAREAEDRAWGAEP